MHSSDVSRGRQIMVRFLALAEERLAHLTELYETKRWTLYFTQAELLDNVREARLAVDAWRLLASPEPLASNRPAVLAWLDSSRRLPSRKPVTEPIAPPRPMHDEAPTAALPALDTAPRTANVASAPIVVATPVVATPIIVPTPIEVTPVQTAMPKLVPVATSSAPPPKPPAYQNALDFALLRERYPLLRRTG